MATFVGPYIVPEIIAINFMIALLIPCHTTNVIM